MRKGSDVMNWLEENINSIVLGDSYELIKKIPDKSIDCIYTDIPYFYVQGGVGNSDLGKRMEKKKMELKQYNLEQGIRYDILNEFIRIMKHINCFIWCSRLQIIDILEFFKQYNCNYDILVWCKTNPSPSTNNTWLSDIEYCLYFREKGKVKLNKGYELKSKYYISSTNKSDKDLYKHPTIKPLDLVKRHILHTTQENDIIFDPFSGSGTTCVVCKEENRNFIGIEIEKEFHKISVDRLNGINAEGQTSIFTDFENL